VFLGACAPKNYVVLLENPEGGSGQVTVATERGHTVLHQPGMATAIDRRTRPPSSPWRLGIDKLQETFSRALGARPAGYERFVVYFKHGSFDLDEDSLDDLEAMLRSARGRPGVDATVIGHADRTADDSINEAVALIRAYRIRDALVGAGVPIERIQLDSYGETRPAVPTEDEVAERLNRRVEVTIR